MIKKRLGVLYRFCVPDSIQPRVDCLRAIKYWRESGVIFIHVPKVAGVSISTSLYGRTLGHIKASDIQSYYPKEFEEMFTFGFIREPNERFLSAVRYLDLNYERLRGSPGMPPTRSLLSNPEKLVDEWLSEQNLSAVNNVFKKQTDFVCDESGKVILNYLARYDDLEKGVSYVANKIGRRVVLENLNSTASKDQEKVSLGLKSKVREIYKDDFALYDSLV